MSKLDEWRLLPPDSRYLTDIAGVSTRFQHLKRAADLSNRAIAELVRQRLNVFGDHIPLDVHYSLALGTLNNFDDSGHSSSVRTLTSLELFWAAPEGYFLSPRTAPAPRAPTPRDNQIALIAHRLRGMDDTALAAVDRIISKLAAPIGNGLGTPGHGLDDGSVR